MKFLIQFLILSIVLTVIVNLLLRFFPGIGQSLTEGARKRAEQSAATGERRARVYFPWKAMVVGSIVLTVLVNLFLVIR